MTHEKIIRSERVYEGQILNLRIDYVQLASDKLHKREIVEHNGAVAIIAIDGDDVLLVKQYRSAIKATLVEIPAGTLETGEEPVACARRELQEEIGMYPERLDPLGSFFPVPGYSTERIYLFLARQLRPSTLPPDADEDISVERMSFAESLKLIDQGEIQDGKTIAGLLRTARYLHSGGEFL